MNKWWSTKVVFFCNFGFQKKWSVNARERAWTLRERLLFCVNAYYFAWTTLAQKCSFFYNHCWCYFAKLGILCGICGMNCHLGLQVASPVLGSAITDHGCDGKWGSCPCCQQGTKASGTRDCQRYCWTIRGLWTLWRTCTVGFSPVTCLNLNVRVWYLPSTDFMNSYIYYIKYKIYIISIIFCISHSEIYNKKYNIVIAISDLGTSHKVGGSTCVGWHHGCQPATNEEEEEGEDWVLNPPWKPCGLACNAVFCRTSLNSLCAMGQGVFCGFPTSDIILFSNYIICITLFNNYSSTINNIQIINMHI